MLRKNTYSRGFRDYQKSLKRASKLREIEMRQYKDPPPPRQVAAVEALRGAAVVLMVAAFERYLRDACEEYIEEIARKAKSTAHPNLQPQFVLSNDYNFVSWLIRDNRDKKVNKIGELKRVAKLIANDHFVPEAFSRTRANPGPETLGGMLRDFGIKNPFRAVEQAFEKHYPKPVPGDFARDQLAAIIGWRNEVAHGGSALSIARGDLEQWVVFMGALGRAVDNTLRDRALAIVSTL